MTTFDTPEAAALADWESHPGSVRVLGVELLGDHRAIVLTDTDPSHPYYTHCRKTDDGWVAVDGHD